MQLYHATYKTNLDSIKEQGLLCKPNNTNWSWANEWSNYSDTGIIFLAKDAFEAAEFCDSSDNVDDDAYNSGIIICVVDTDDLDVNYLSYDPFYHNNIEEEFEDPYFEYLSVLEQANCFAYTKDIPSNVLSFYEIDEWNLVPVK